MLHLLMIIINSGHTTSSPRLPMDKLLKGKKKTCTWFRGKTSLKTGVNRKRFRLFYTFAKTSTSIKLSKSDSALNFKTNNEDVDFIH